MPLFLRVVAFLSMALSVPAPAFADEVTRAFVGGRILPISGEPIEAGTLLIRGSRIVAVGPAASVRVPSDAEVHDVQGKVLMPGSGYESYVPKTRVVLFEAAEAAAFGLPRDAALEAITLGAARLIGVAERVGSLDLGKDGDVALWDGDPFEWTTHCVGVVIEGVVTDEGLR